jgi:hypothetical protein
MLLLVGFFTKYIRAGELKTAKTQTIMIFNTVQPMAIKKLIPEEPAEDIITGVLIY